MPARTPTVEGMKNSPSVRSNTYLLTPCSWVGPRWTPPPATGGDPMETARGGRQSNSDRQPSAAGDLVSLGKDRKAWARRSAPLSLDGS
jgi:hypothetical protein